MQGNHTSNLAAYTKFKLPRERVNYLLNKYIKVKEPLRGHIEEIREELFGDSFIIGVHFRNTDKYIIYSPPNAKKTILKVQNEVDQLLDDDYRIFVATDDGHFLKSMISHFGDKVVYTDSFRSYNRKPLHGNRAYSPYEQGKETVIDCVLLSHSNVLVKTQSNLNEVASAWNLDVKVINVEPQKKKMECESPQNELFHKKLD